MSSPLKPAPFLLSFSIALSGCSNQGGQTAGQDSGSASDSTAIPRFPEEGIPQSSGAEESTGPGAQPETGPGPEELPNGLPTGLPTGLPESNTTAGPKASSSPTTSSSTSSTRDSSSSSASTSTSSSETSSSGTASSETSSSGTSNKDQVAPYVDAGLFKVISLDDGSIHTSEKWRSPAKEHQYLRVGNRRITNYGGSYDSGNVTLASYLIFDVSAISNAKQAQIQVFLFASSNANNGYGGYNSSDPLETVQVRSLDRYSPKQILDAPFGQGNDHDLDLGIFSDLSDGVVYAQRDFGPDSFSVDKLEPTPTATPKRRNCSNTRERACGRWVSFELSAQAVQAINEAQGLWATGWSMSTITHDKDPASDDITKSELIQEWLFVGGFFDLDPNKNAYPDYIGPKPRLLITQ